MKIYKKKEIYPLEELTEKQRTEAQNRALHLWFEQLASVLREQGLDMKKAINTNFDIIPTKESVKEMIWRPIQIAMFNKHSTTELIKLKEIDDIYDVINKHFGEMGISVPSFPSIEVLENKQDEELSKITTQ